jgi:transposase
MDHASLEELLGRGLSLVQIGCRFGRHESTIAYWVEKHGCARPTTGSTRHAAGSKGASSRLLVDRGMTIAEIAQAVEPSKSTVRYWLTRHGLKTGGRRGRRASEQVRVAKHSGLLTVHLDCARHGETEYYLDGCGYYRCKQCRSEAVARRRRKMKMILVTEAGGCCCICGYDRSMRALHFHHLEPALKRHAINAKGVAVALEKLRAEARTCVLLCSNCHAEVEDGLASIPERVSIALRGSPFGDPG